MNQAIATRKIYLTTQGKEKFENELTALENYLQILSNKLHEVQEKDIGQESAELEITRQEYDFAETRIAWLLRILKNAVLLRPSRDRSKVQLGSRVEVRAGSQTRHFQILGSLETNPTSGTISDESTVGKSLLGKKVGDKVAIDNADPPTLWQIISIF